MVLAKDPSPNSQTPIHRSLRASLKQSNEPFPQPIHKNTQKQRLPLTESEIEKRDVEEEI